MIDEVSHHKQLNQLGAHHPVPHEGFNRMVWIRELVERGGPENEGHDLRQGLRGQEMRGMGCCLTFLHEHEELAEDCN